MNAPTPAAPTEIEHCYRLSLTVSEHSARHIRHILRTLLSSWGTPAVAEPAELALTELIANVVRHVPDRRCVILLLRRELGVRVEVTDTSPTPPRPTHPVPDSESGRGLLLLAAVTDRWGWERLPEDRHAKRIWFECDTKP